MVLSIIVLLILYADVC